MNHVSTLSCKYPLFVILIICFAGAILGDSTAESLLLAHFDATLVPRMFIVNAVFLFLCSAFLITVIDRVNDRGLFFSRLLLVHAIILLGIRWALSAHATFLFLPLYSYAYVTKIVIFLIFWTLANDLIDSRRAGYEFPFIAAGGTLGAISVGFCIPWMLKLVQPENLLLVWVALIVTMLAIFRPMRKKYQYHFTNTSGQILPRRRLCDMLTDLKLLRTEPLLGTMATLYFLLFFMLLNQQYTFYSALRNHFILSSGSSVDAKALASFLGYFNGICMGVTFLLQITLAGRLIKKLGSTRSLFVLPTILCIVFGVQFYLNARMASTGIVIGNLIFWSVIAGMGIRIGFFDSFFSPNFQIFFSSLPQDIRGRGKLCIEGVVKPLAFVCASIWIMTVAVRLTPWMNYAVLFIVALVLLFQTHKLKGTYTESLTRYLRGFSPHKATFLQNMLNSSERGEFLRVMRDMLEREKLEIKEFIVELLVEINSDESIAMLLTHAASSDARNRATIISALTGVKRDDIRSFLSSVLNDPDNRVTANCIGALGAFSEPEIDEGLRVFLNHGDNRIKANTIVALWPRATATARKEFMQTIYKMLNSGLSQDVASALYVLGTIKSPDGVSTLTNFYNQIGIGLLQTRSVFRQFCRALSAYPCADTAKILFTCAASATSKKQRELANTLGTILEQTKPENIRQYLQTGSVVERSLVVQSLLLHSGPVEAIGRETLVAFALNEIKHVYEAWQMVATFDETPDNVRLGLLRSAVVEEVIGHSLSMAISAVALIDPTRFVRKVMNRLNHENRHVRARAFEILDNAGDVKVNRWIIRLLEHDNPQQILHGAEGEFVPVKRTLSEYITVCCSSPIMWVRECALFVGSEPAKENKLSVI